MSYHIIFGKYKRDDSLPLSLSNYPLIMAGSGAAVLHHYTTNHIMGLFKFQETKFTLLLSAFFATDFLFKCKCLLFENVMLLF